MSLPIIGAAGVFGAYKLGQVLGRKIRETVTHKSSASMYPHLIGPRGMYKGPASSSTADSRFTHQAQYRPMTAKPPYKNPMPQWALDRAGRRDNSYKGTYVGSTVSKPKQKPPSDTPSSTNGVGGGGRPRQAGPSKKQIQARRAAIKDLLSKAEKAAAAGNIQAAANFSAAALNRQKAGKGSAASMKRVTKVARTYSTAAGRKKIENQEAGRTRLGKPPVKGKKG